MTDAGKIIIVLRRLSQNVFCFMLICMSISVWVNLNLWFLKKSLIWC